MPLILIIGLILLRCNLTSAQEISLITLMAEMPYLTKAEKNRTLELAKKYGIMFTSLSSLGPECFFQDRCLRYKISEDGGKTVFAFSDEEEAYKRLKISVKHVKELIEAPTPK